MKLLVGLSHLESSFTFLCSLNFLCQRKAIESDKSDLCKLQIMQEAEFQNCQGTPHRMFLECTKCENWVHKRCFRMRRSTIRAIKFICRRCQDLLDENQDKRITLDRGDTEAVDRFSYLVDVFSTEGVQGPATSRIRKSLRIPPPFCAR